MILYFANRKMQILGQASTALPDGFVIMDDLKTEEVDSGIASFECTISYATESCSKIEEMMQAGNYILRSHDGENEFYTIIDYEGDAKEQTVHVYAEDAGLDLLNEIAGEFASDAAHNAEWYINKYIVDSGFEIGINEIPSDSVRTLSWDGESTVTERLASIANSFGGYEVSYSFDIDRLEVKRKFINFHAKRGEDNSAQLRLNREIDNIRTIQSIANLATALRVTGGVPESEDAEEEMPPITLVGYEYDDGDIFVGEDGVLRSREALKKWSRYIWNKEPGLVGGAYEGHIAKWYSYETTSQAELCAHAVAELKRVCDMEVNYEVEINRLPDNVKIGDRVEVVDEAGKLFLSTRILVLETSVVEQTQNATLGEHLLKTSGISDKVFAMAENLTNVLRTTEQTKQSIVYVKGVADAANGKADAAQNTAQSAQNTANAAQDTANEANQTATQAKQEVSDAEKVATNYIDAIESGLVIGNMTADVLGNNVLIDSDSVDIRHGDTILASYSATKIELGKNSTESIISLCGDNATIKYKDFGASKVIEIESKGVELRSDEDNYLVVLQTAITGIGTRIGFSAEDGLSLSTNTNTIDISTSNGSIYLSAPNTDIGISASEIFLDGTIYSEDHIFLRTPYTGTWSRGMFWKSHDLTTTLGGIGATGSSSGNLDYVYIGTGYANAPFRFDIADKAMYCAGSGTFVNGIHIGGEAVGTYPYIYASGKVLYIRCGETYWAFGETGMTKNGVTKIT